MATSLVSFSYIAGKCVVDENHQLYLKNDRLMAGVNSWGPYDSVNFSEPSTTRKSTFLPNPLVDLRIGDPKTNNSRQSTGTGTKLSPRHRPATFATLRRPVPTDLYWSEEEICAGAAAARDAPQDAIDANVDNKLYPCHPHQMRRQQKVRRPRRPPLGIGQHERPRINISRAEDPFDNRPRVPA